MRKADVELYRTARHHVSDLSDFLLLATFRNTPEQAHEELTRAIECYHRVGNLIQIIHEKIHAGEDH